MKVGLFFGSFNPIHIGHLALANYMVEYGPIEQLWFVVTPQNPLKRKNKLLDDYQRLEMVNRAIGDDFRFQANDIEFRLSKPNYTANTMAYLREKHPRNEFFLIMGADNYVSLKKWRNWEILVKEHQFLIYPRPGFDHQNIDMGSNFHIVDAPLIEISSSFIRRAIAEGKDVRHFLPKQVFQYLEEMNFYK